jgi:hypothetical protein
MGSTECLWSCDGHDSHGSEQAGTVRNVTAGNVTAGNVTAGLASKHRWNDSNGGIVKKVFDNLRRILPQKHVFCLRSTCVGVKVSDRPGLLAIIQRASQLLTFMRSYQKAFKFNYGVRFHA